MVKPKTTNAPIHADVYEKVKEYCNGSGLKYSTIISEAVEMYLKAKGVK